MCQISDTLILCGCQHDLDLENNHWMLNRFVDGKEELILGETMLPNLMDPEIFKSNVEKLAKMLNTGNCFDTQMTFQDKDQLILFLKGKAPSANMQMYAFEYSKKKWNSISTEILMLNRHHDTIILGSVLNSTHPNARMD